MSQLDHGSLHSFAFSDDDLDGNSKHSTRTISKGRTERQTLARSETKAVGCLRILVLFILLLSAIALSYKVYTFTRDDEREDFEEQFKAQGARVVDQFHASIAQTLHTFDGFSVAATSLANFTGQNFPNVTIPDFVYRGSTSRILSEAIMVAFLPLVHEEHRAGWEAYTEASIDEIQLFASTAEITSQMAQNLRYNINASVEFERPNVKPAGAPIFTDEIWSLDANIKAEARPVGSGPYTPIWQMSPAPFLPAMQNMDMRDIAALGPTIDATLTTGAASFAAFVPADDAEAKAMEKFFDIILLLGQFRADQTSYENDPISPLAYPVFDSFGPDRDLVGVFVGLFYWRLHFEHVLPEGVDGVVCVLENREQGQAFTYVIDGPNVTYEGVSIVEEGNDVEYEHELSVNIVEELNNTAGLETRSYTSVELNEEFNNYKLRVYPSQTFKDRYVTDKPMLYAIGAGGIFLFASIVFLAYDWLVERRQEVVMDRAVRGIALVSSLFPEAIKERLLLSERTDAKEQLSSDGKEMWLEGVNEIKLDEDGDFSVPLETSLREPKKLGKPIAEKYQDTTVMFGDLAGFTKWSSTRNPEDVFVLLETLYAAFDQMAKKRKVFKVETIGDCYLAVTGLPNPQSDHAVRMTKFARECGVRMKDVTRTLADTMGADTINLALRVGLHSGSVTAGVLRGDKARFQLFGDTVNTASRMESNGMPGRIQCSQETAEYLTASHKAHWLIKRSKLLVAKGKGSMQTYWVNPSATLKIMSEGTDGSNSMALLSSDTASEREEGVAAFEENEVSLAESATESFHLTSPRFAASASGVGRAFIHPIPEVEGTMEPPLTNTPQATMNVPVETATAKYDNATVMVADVSRFSEWAASLDNPSEGMEFLTKIFSSFDAVATDYPGLVGIENHSTQYIIACFEESEGKKKKPSAAALMAEFADTCIARMTSLVSRNRSAMQSFLSLRIGISTGTVIATSISQSGTSTVPKHQMYGPALDTATTLKEKSRNRQILCCETAAANLRGAGQAEFLFPFQAKSANGKRIFLIDFTPDSGDEDGDLCA